MELWRLIQAYVDEYGSTATWVAKQMGTTSQTLYNWRDRGVKDLPENKSLRELAKAIRQPYPKVLAAALIDSGRWTDDDGELKIGTPLGRSVRKRLKDRGLEKYAQAEVDAEQDDDTPASGSA